jgi:hypothetical protein
LNLGFFLINIVCRFMGCSLEKPAAWTYPSQSDYPLPYLKHKWGCFCCSQATPLPLI